MKLFSALPLGIMFLTFATSAYPIPLTLTNSLRVDDVSQQYSKLSGAYTVRVNTPFGTLRYPWEAGIQFYLNGPITYQYVLPIDVNLQHDGTATAGSSIALSSGNVALAPGGTVQVNQTLKFGTRQNFTGDVPLDGLSAARIVLDQRSDRLVGRVKAPAPGNIAPWVSFDTRGIFGSHDPFRDGRVSYGGATVQLGGARSLGQTLSAYSDDPLATSRTFSGQAIEDNAWFSTGDQITFLASSGIPYVAAAALVLDVARFDLDHAVNLDILRQDSLSFENIWLDLGPDELLIPSNTPEDSWFPFVVEGKLHYSVEVTSTFLLDGLTELILDGPGFRPKTLLNVAFDDTAMTSSPVHRYWMDLVMPVSLGSQVYVGANDDDNSIPEPSAMLLLAVGIFAMVAARKRPGTAP